MKLKEERTCAFRPINIRDVMKGGITIAYVTE
jgi:hypothetical protein